MLRCLLLPIALLAAMISPTQAATVSLVPGASESQVGQTVSLEVRISEIGSNGLGTFDLDVTFDPALVTFSGATFGTGLDVLGLGSIQAATPTATSVNLFELSLDSVDDLLALQSDSFLLATLNFAAAAPGLAGFSLSLNALGDAIGDPISASLIGAAVNVAAGGPSTVAEPAPFALLSAALLALGFFHRRRAIAQ